MPIDRVQLIEEQPHFFRNNFRRLLTVCLILVIVNIGLISLILYQYFTRHPVNYFAVTSDGRLIEITPTR
jgi:hypothetical protein